VSLPGFFVCNYGQFEKKIKAIDSRRTDHFEDQSAVLTRLQLAKILRLESRGEVINKNDTASCKTN
jgi:hypothetical protein